jgi:hypothetical protein
MHSVFRSASFTSYSGTSIFHTQTLRFSQLYVIFLSSWWKAHMNNIKFELFYISSIFTLYFSSPNKRNVPNFANDSLSSGI